MACNRPFALAMFEGAALGANRYKIICCNNLLFIKVICYCKDKDKTDVTSFPYFHHKNKMTWLLKKNSMQEMGTLLSRTADNCFCKYSSSCPFLWPSLTQCIRLHTVKHQRQVPTTEIGKNGRNRHKSREIKENCDQSPGEIGRVGKYARHDTTAVVPLWHFLEADFEHLKIKW